MKTSHFLRPWVLVLLIATLYICFITWRSGGPMGMVLPGSRFAEGLPTGTEGYDGQFVYYIARAPLDAASLIDVPPYRYQRILYPLLARLLALGHTALIPWTLPLINLMALAAGTALVETMLVEQRTSRWYALTVGLYAGQLLSQRVDLPEPLAIALSLGGMLAFARQKLGTSALLFALAALTKETSLLFVAGYGVYLWLHTSQRQAIRFISLAAGPFVVYQIVLWLWLGSPGIGSGGAGASGFEIIPFAGLFRIAGVSWPAFALFSLIMLPMAVLPALWSLSATLRDILRGNDHPWVFALCANAAIIPFIPFSTYREPLAMLRLTIPLVACVVLYGGLRQSKRVLFYSRLWLVSNIILVKDPFF